jgi:hypothetical protein
MKIEVSESLVFSWLRHEKHCQVVQMNWKTSPEWDAFEDDNELNRLYKKSNKLFDYGSKEVKDSDQFIKQGEVDAIGIELDIDKPYNIKNIHAVDVAFHESGLNYDGEEGTKNRIVKKYIRTALSVYKFFGCKRGDIYFVTPITYESHRNTFIEAKNSVNKFFIEEGFNFSFHFYSNEDFYRYIFVPVERISTVMTDTSEYFARSLKLVRLMHGIRKESGETIDVKEKSNLDEEKGIGLIVRECFDNLSRYQLLSIEMINNLCSKEYSKNTFKLSYPVLITDENRRVDAKGRARYYASPYYFNNQNNQNNQKYFLCNDWYDRHRQHFLKWYNLIIKK